MLDAPDRFRFAPLAALFASVALLGAFGAGCAQTQEKNIEDPQNLRQRVAHFHRFMRWEEFSRASKVIAPEFRHTFLGRYEEYGDDLDIVGLEVQRVRPHDEERRRVQVEQRWFVKPDMTVENEDYVEIWRESDDGWMLEDRMTEEKWDDRHDESSDDSNQKAGAQRTSRR